MKDSLSVIWLDEVDSTNSEALAAADGSDGMSVVAAVRQISGRGRRGSRWLSSPGMNLTFSLVVRYGRDGVPPVAARDQFAISEAASLAVADYLAGNGIEAKVKWPNDIYVNDRKICGILIENSLSGSSVSRSVIGIGLDVNQKDFPPEIPNPTSMSLLTGNEYDLRAELPRLLENLCASLRRLGTQHEEFCGRLYLKDVISEYSDLTCGGLSFRGRIRGVSPVGMLLIEKEEGELKEFAFNEIKYVIQT